MFSVLAAGSSFAATVYTEDAFYYTIEENSITITGYFGDEDVINIPSVIAGIPVNHIAPYAFEGSSVTIVNLPETIETVEKGAFDANVTVNYFMREDRELSAEPETDNVGLGEKEPGDQVPEKSSRTESGPGATPSGNTGNGVSAGGRISSSVNDDSGSAVTSYGAGTASGNGPSGEAPSPNGETPLSEEENAAEGNQVALDPARIPSHRTEPETEETVSAGDAGAAPDSFFFGHMEDEIDEDVIGQNTGKMEEETGVLSAVTGFLTGNRDTGGAAGDAAKHGLLLGILFAAGIFTGLFLIVYLILLLIRRRKDDEEEERKS